MKQKKQQRLRGTQLTPRESRVTPNRDRGQVKPHGHKRLFKFDELSATKVDLTRNQSDHTCRKRCFTGVVTFLFWSLGEVEICARNSGVQHVSRPEGCDLNSGH